MASRIKGITVEIGGDTTGLDKALKNVNATIRTTQSSLKDVNKLLKLDPANTELLAQKQKLLKDAIGSTKEKLDALKTAQEQAKQQLENGDLGQDKYDALQREIIETEQELQKLAQEAVNSNAALAKIEEVGGKLESVGNKISGVGTKMLPVTAAVAGLGTAAVKTTADFDSSMSQVQATMGITADSMSKVDGQSVNTMDTLRTLAKQMGEKTAFSASECAQALNYLALAGYDTQQMCDTLPTVLNLAAAGDIDLASASDMVTDAMSALGMQTDEANTMVDQMAKTASTTNTSVAQLGEGILTIGATAKSVKGGTAELNTALGILANNGIKGAEGGTHLRNVILALQSPTDKAAACMESLGLQVYDSQGNMRSLNDILSDLNKSMDGMTSAEKNNIISTIFNKTDLASVNSLLANTGDTWDSLQKSITESGGAAQQMADTQLDNLSGQITILKSAVEGLAISFGEALMPVIRSLVSKIQGFVDKLNSMDESQRNLIIRVAAVVVAIGPFLIILGKTISTVGTAMKGFSSLAKGIASLGVKIAGSSGSVTGLASALGAVAGPVLAVIAVVAVLVAAFKHLWDTNEEFRNVMTAIWEGIVKKVQAFVEGIKEIFSGIWNGITGIFTAALNLIRGIADTVLGWFGTSWNAVWTSVSTFFTNIWNGITSFFTGVWETIKNVVQIGILFIGSLLEAAFNIITLPFRFVWENCKETIISVWNTIKSTVSTVIDAVASVISTVMNTIKTVISTVWDAVSTKISTVLNAIKSVVTTVFNAVKTVAVTVWNGIKTAISAVVDGIKSKVSSVFEALKNTLSSVFNGIKSTAVSVWNGIKSAIVTPIEAARDTIKGIVDKITGFFNNMHLSLPHIKLPHFSISGKLSLAPPSVPHLNIDWYKEGGIMTGPTIFGMNGSSLMAGGEAGKEAVLPLKGFYEQLENILTNRLNTSAMEQYLAVIAENSGKGIYLDDGTLIGKLAPGINQKLGMQKFKAERGMV